MAIKASGSFEALYKFLTLLENSPYELDFISMDIQKLGGEIVAMGTVKEILANKNSLTGKYLNSTLRIADKKAYREAKGNVEIKHAL